MNKKDIKSIIDNNLRIPNGKMLLNIFKEIRNIKESELKNNITIYPEKEYKHVTWYDYSLGRLVSRYKDIMLCLDFYDKHHLNRDTDNIYVLKKIIRGVARDSELDRVVYIRVFINDFESDKGINWQNGYTDKNHEFNKDILDLIDIYLENIADNGTGLEKVFGELKKLA